jgi:hypothetical protein
MDFFEKNIACIKEKIPNVEIVKKNLDYTNYIEILQKLSLIIKNERELNPNCDILINIGTGSKITALASTEASRLWNCKILYVHSTKYDPLIEGAEHKGKMITIEPQVFPLQKPPQKLIEVLKIIENSIKEKYKKKEVKSTPQFIYKKNLIQILRDNGYLTLKSKHINPRFQQSSYYSKIDKNFLEPLKNELNYIRISDDKKNKKVFITKKGEIVLKIFKYLI